MQFTIPQFIEKEPKIIGPFTFKQFIFIGIAVAICIFLYFTVPMFVFVVSAIILLGGGFSLALLKVERTPLPTIIKNSFLFLFKPKLYLWKKRNFTPRVLKRERFLTSQKKEDEKKEKENPLLSFGKGGRLKKLFTNLEVKK